MVAIGAEPTAPVRSVGLLHQKSCGGWSVVLVMWSVESTVSRYETNSLQVALPLFYCRYKFSRYPQSCPLYSAQKIYIYAGLLWLHRQLFLRLRIVSHTEDCLIFCFLHSCFFGFSSYLTESTVSFKERSHLCTLACVLSSVIFERLHPNWNYVGMF